jgi:hypothetical protein
MSALTFTMVFLLGAVFGRLISIIFDNEKRLYNLQIDEPIERLAEQEKTKIKDFETMLLEYESETETVTWEVTKNKS